MKEVNYIPLSTVLADVYSIVDKSITEESEMIEWAAQAFASIKVNVLYEMRVAFSPIVNYRAKLPKGAKFINQVQYKASENEDDVEQIKLFTATEDEVTAKYWEFTNSAYYINNWLPMRMSTSLFHQAIMIKNSPNFHYKCEEEFSIDKDGCITTTVEEGWVAISYMSYPKRNGEFLIPDDVDLLKAIKAYIMYRHWEKRDNHKEEGAERRLIRYQREWEILAAKSRGYAMLPDINGLENLQQQLLRHGPHTNNFYSAFGHLGTGETTDFGWSSGDRSFYSNASQ